MGLTIHYKGSLKTKDALAQLIEEVKDIAEIHQWKCQIFEKEFPMNCFGRKKFNNRIFGIAFDPPGCETVSMTFLSNGKLVSFNSFIAYIKSLGKHKDLIGSGASYVKTQYAGAEIHKILVHLFDYLSKKYFRNFIVQDEAQYWETRDEEVLRKNFAYMEGLIEGFASALETNAMKPGETFEEYVLRIANRFHRSGHHNI